MRRWLIAPVAALALSACSETGGIAEWAEGEDKAIERVAALPAPDDPYLAALKDGYLQSARTELAQVQWADAGEFRRKSERAANGERFGPRDPGGLYIPEATREGVVAAYAEISGYLASEGAMLRAARQLGEAQVFFDCWLQEALEGYADQDIADCREKYELMIALIRDLANLPDNMAVVLPEDNDGPIGGIELAQGGKKITLDQPFAAAGLGKSFGDLPVTEGEIRDAFAGALAAQPKPPVIFELTFAFNSTRISDEAFEAILDAAEEARTRAAAEVIVIGHADRPGDPGANLAVSRARAHRVAEAVFNELRDEESVTFIEQARGARDPAENRAGQVAANRRVVIMVR